MCQLKVPASFETGIGFCCVLRLPDEPDEEIARYDRRESERHAVLHEGRSLDLVPLLAQDADARDVRRCAYRGQVSAERRAAEQTVVHDFRVDAEIHGDDGYDGEHGGRVGDIVNERRENNRHPDYNGVDDEHAARAAADLRYRVADYINNARILYAAYDDEKTGQQEDGVVIYLLERIFDKLCVLAEQLADYADKEEKTHR